MIEKLQPLRYTKLIIIPEKSFSRITSVSSRRSRRLEGVLGVRGIPGILASRDWVLLFHHAVMIHKSERWIIIIKRKHQCWQQQATKRDIFLNLLKRDLAKYICTTFGSSEFLNNHISSCYKALYLVSSSVFRHLDFIRVIR